MRCSRLTDESLLADARYLAEPKLDGQRAQVHVLDGRTVAAYSASGRPLLHDRGLGWLRAVSWPVRAAILDGELYQGGGTDGAASVLAARRGAGADLALAAFDLLHLDGRPLVDEPWDARRARLEQLVGHVVESRVQLVPVTGDAKRLWDVWVEERGGEGIVLKRRESVYEPGQSSTAWLKRKARLTVQVHVLSGGEALVEWGDWAHAALLTFTYWHPRREETVTVEQAVRVPNPAEWRPRSGATARLLCWGLMPGGPLRHPIFVGWGA